MISYEKSLMWVIRLGAIGMAWLVFRSVLDFIQYANSPYLSDDELMTAVVFLWVPIVLYLITFLIWVGIGVLCWTKASALASWLVRPHAGRKMLNPDLVSPENDPVGQYEAGAPGSNEQSLWLWVDQISLQKSLPMLLAGGAYGLGLFLVYLVNYEMLEGLVIQLWFFISRTLAMMDTLATAHDPSVIGLAFYGLQLVIYVLLMLGGFLLFNKARTRLHEISVMGQAKAQFIRQMLGLVYLLLAVIICCITMTSVRYLLINFILSLLDFTEFSDGSVAGGGLFTLIYALVILSVPLIVLRFALHRLRTMPLATSETLSPRVEV